MKDSRDYLNLLVAMTVKEIRARYKKAIFGLMWVILNPILQMFVIGVIFSFFINIPDYFLFLFAGLLHWQFFVTSLNRATSSFVNQRSLLKKSRFPKEVIPLSIIFSNFFHLVISTSLFLAFLLFAGKAPIISLLYLVPALIWLLVLTIGVSLITASLNVRFRDVGFVVQPLTTLWFYATPVLYSLDIIPSNLQLAFNFNPLSSVFELIHLALLGQGGFVTNMAYYNLVVTVLVFLVGVLLYKKENRYFVDWL